MRPLSLKQKILPLMLAMLLVLAVSPAFGVHAEGITGQITASSTSVVAGSNVTVTFSAVPAVTISAYQVTVSFDTSKFEYVSGQDLTGLNGGNSVDNNGSKISVYAYGDTGIANIRKLCKLTFRAKAEGAASFTTSDAVINSESPASTAVTVTVTAAGATTSSTTAKPTTVTTETPEATLELTDGTYKIIPIPKDLPTPTGFYKTLIAVSGQKMEAFKSTKGDLVLLYLDSDASGTNLYFYDSNSNSVYLYNPFSVPGHDFVLVRPDTSAVVPEGFSSTSLTIDSQQINCWKKTDVTSASDPYYETYLLYLMDSEGQKGFFLFKPSNQMIFPYLMISVDPGEQTTSSEAATPIASQTTPEASVVTTGNTTSFNVWMIAAAVLGLLCLMLIGFLTWTYFEYVRPTEQVQVQISRESQAKPPKIRRVD